MCSRTAASHAAADIFGLIFPTTNTNNLPCPSLVRVLPYRTCFACSFSYMQSVGIQCAVCDMSGSLCRSWLRLDGPCPDRVISRFVSENAKSRTPLWKRTISLQVCVYWRTVCELSQSIPLKLCALFHWRHQHVNHMPWHAAVNDNLVDK